METYEYQASFSIFPISTKNFEYFGKSLYVFVILMQQKYLIMFLFFRLLDESKIPNIVCVISAVRKQDGH